MHLYEGHSAHDVAAGVRFLARAGIERLDPDERGRFGSSRFYPGLVDDDHGSFESHRNHAAAGRNGICRLKRRLFPALARAFRRRRTSRQYRAASRRLCRRPRPGIRNSSGGKDAAPPWCGRDRHVDCLRDHSSARSRPRGGGIFLPNELGGGIEFGGAFSSRSARGRRSAAGKT